ncbi:MAG: preprotein translocase subunit SecE [Patescibacteria group bacterium]
MNSFFTYLKNVRGELSHVVWPGRNQTIIHTILVVVISAVVALLLAGFDYIFSGVIARFIGF